MESVCGLERGCYVQRGPTPRRGSHKYWQIDSHMTPHPSRLLTRTNPLQISSPSVPRRICTGLRRLYAVKFYPLAGCTILFYLPYLLVFAPTILVGSSPGSWHAPAPSLTQTCFRTPLSRSTVPPFDSCGSWQMGRTVESGGVKKNEVQGLSQISFKMFSKT